MSEMSEEAQKEDRSLCDRVDASDDGADALDALRSELERIREEGLDRQSAGAFRTLEALIDRIPSLPERARRVLIRRARSKFEAFEASARAERDALLQRLESADVGEEAEAYRERIRKGELESTRRALRRIRRGGRRLLGRPIERIRIDEPLAEPPSPKRRALRASRPMAKADRYREAALDAAAELTLLRAKRQLPEPELRGRYHAPSIAAESLAIMERVGRPYLLQQIARLEAYEAVAALIDEYRPKKPKARAKKGRGSRR